AIGCAQEVLWTFRNAPDIGSARSRSNGDTLRSGRRERHGDADREDRVLNRKVADLRQPPELEPRALRYDRTAPPPAVVRTCSGARRKTKGGAVIAGPGFPWASFYFPGRWSSITSAYDAAGALVAHHVDLCVPPEERDGMLSFLDLKLDLLLRADGSRS